ncbi:nickel ABC transporter ATP-binding protein NikE [Cohaesibacter sp. CAU 1516]|uniref:ABC transporter ATP-binding protein/permease n=1 Tax=Cohaesibacter sp. CAU 1516 TaxID=2576038 RepID=UPI0010FE1E5E|nr:nickel ABC transporter ATP-binding protein NikE [Cohaesibacter sp. CAU 1516]TLP44303.1 nickel ABC transporter ATP-binding protein NikE [Cohaesibacter sp. CAU 1516]
MAKTSTAFDLKRFAGLAPFSSLTGKVQLVGLGLLLVVVVCALFAPLLAPYGPRAEVCAAFASPSHHHWLGCDDFGQDLYSQLLYGAQVSLFVGLVVALLATGLATTLALIAGLDAGGRAQDRSGWLDRLLMRLVDVALALPLLPLVIVLGVYFGASIWTQIVVITLVMWAQPLRELRSQILSIRAATFVEASRAMGASGWFVSMRHILPALAPLIVPQFVRVAHNAILIEASLNFLGLGDPLTTSWGTILFHANGRAAFLTGAWVHWILPPGLAIAVTIMALAFIGYGFDGTLMRRMSVKGRKTGGAAIRSKPPQGEGGFLQIDGLQVVYQRMDGSPLVAVKDATLSVQHGEVVGLVGESGSGKSSLALAVLRLSDPAAGLTAGAIRLDGTDLLSLSDEDIRILRRTRIGLIPQNAMNALNPVLTIGEQVMERLVGAGVPPARRLAIAKDWMTKVGLTPKHLSCYPHHLSGGMRQRAVIAVALCCRPDLLIADEPTSGLDVLVQQSLMDLLLHLRKEMGLTMLLVSHNLPLIARHCDRVARMEHGVLTEVGSDAGPCPLRALLETLPTLKEPRRWAAPALPIGNPVGEVDEPPLLECLHLTKQFPVAGASVYGLRRKERVTVLDDLSFTLQAGESVGLVGGSGAGKTTLARLLLGLCRPDAGSILIKGMDWNSLSRADARRMRQKVQMVFQDPYQSLNNRMQVGDLVAEPMRIVKGGGWADRQLQICEALDRVRLPTDRAFLNRLPVSLSGGQRQRVALARAIVTCPSLIIADEPTSMIDQAIRMEVMDVLASLRVELGTAFLFISHDIALARHFCDRLMVLNRGRLVEEAPSDALIADPQHAYTKALIAAV